MRHLKSAAVALGLGLFASGAALAAANCCEEKGKPCCEEKDGKRMPCCDKHKEQAGKPATPKPPADPHAEHKH